MNPPGWDSAWLCLGTHIDAWGSAAPVYITAADLNRHAVVLGTTGSGKSTLLRNLVVQYLGHGGSVVVMEPHGDLIFRQDGILAALTPEQLPHVTVLDPTEAWVPQLNLATVDWQSGTDVAVQSALSAIRAMEEAGWHDVVRVREILDHTLRMLLEVEGQGASLLHAHRFLVSAKYRKQILDDSGGRVLISKSYWERRLDQWSTNRFPSLLDVLEPSERRIGGFLRDSRFRHTLALPPLVPEMALNLDALLNAPDPHLLVVPLLTTQLGTVGKRTFGTLLLQMLSNLFLRRPPGVRRPTMILIDEFPDFAGDEMGELIRKLLAQGRKFGAAIVLAAQSLSQLPEAVKREIQLNTSTKIILKTEGAEDAAIGAANLGAGELEAGHFTDMGQFHGYARTIVHGQTRPAFYFKALPAQAYLPLVLPRPRPLVGDLKVPDDSILTALQGLHDRAQQNPEEVTKEIVAMTPAVFGATVQAQAYLNRHLLRLLIRHPEVEPDPVKRVVKVSRAAHCLPTWLLEAQFRRLLDHEQEKKLDVSVPETTPPANKVG
jgi:energy-coupling factor transporter ATP-binding protein EcfA2